MPDLTSPFVPQHPDEPDVTKKQEFQLQTEMRGKEKVKAWMEHVSKCTSMWWVPSCQTTTKCAFYTKQDG